MATPAEGALAKMAMDDVLPFDTSSQPFEFLNESFVNNKTFVESHGVRGTYSRKSARVAIATEAPSGTININPVEDDFDRMLPRVLGGATDVDDTLPEFQVMIDRVTKVFTYTACRVASMTLSGTSGQAFAMSLNLEGETETVGSAGTFPALTLDTDNIFTFHKATLTLESTAREFRDFSLTVNNFLDTTRFMNSQTRTEIPQEDRQVTFTVNSPYTTDNADLYDIAIAGAVGTLAIAGDNSAGQTATYTFTFGNVKIPARSPNVPGKSEIMLPLTCMSYAVEGGNSEISWAKVLT